MSLSLILACVWAVIAAFTAMLPMRKQYIPGIPLLIAIPFLLAFLGYQHGPWPVLLVTAGIASMMRNPLIYFYRRARGLPVSLPTELQDNRK